jgi:hypothetical protein
LARKVNKPETYSQRLIPMRTPALPPSSLYSHARRRAGSRIDVSGILPWGELFVIGLLLMGYSLIG